MSGPYKAYAEKALHGVMRAYCVLFMAAACALLLYCNATRLSLLCLLFLCLLILFWVSCNKVFFRSTLSGKYILGLAFTVYLALYAIAFAQYELSETRLSQLVTAIYTQTLTENKKHLGPQIVKLNFEETSEMPFLFSFSHVLFAANPAWLKKHYSTTVQAKIEVVKLLRAYENWRELELSGADLSETELSSVCLDGASVLKSNFHFAVFQHSSFDCADLMENNFPDSRFIESSFAYSDLILLKFDRSQLSRSRFDASQIGQCSFSNCLFSDTCFKKSAIWGSYFTEADITGADFSDAKITDSHFENAVVATFDNLESLRSGDIPVKLADLPRTCKVTNYTGAMLINVTMNPLSVIIDNQAVTIDDAYTDETVIDLLVQMLSKAGAIAGGKLPLPVYRKLYADHPSLFEESALLARKKDFSATWERSALYREQLLSQ